MADSTQSAREALQSLPSVDDLISEFPPDSFRLSRAQLLAQIRANLDQFRREISAGNLPGDVPKAVRARLLGELLVLARPTMRPVINGTGVVLHTGLGRAPLGDDMLAEAHAAMRGYTHLELDLDSGKRGERLSLVEPALKALTGSAGALVVNNNAAAVLLMVNSLAEGREVLISRGQLVEIGGSFRIPDVIAKAGAKMVEVGTTNRTHLADYNAALTDRTAALLYVHPSNYRVEGFTATVTVKELAALARKKRLPLLVDLGSGSLMRNIAGVTDEPTVAAIVKAGASLTSFSGDKLLGGPQAGLVVGKSKWLKLLRKNSLYRALRCDKITLALLDQALRSYVDDRTVRPENLTQRLLARDRDALTLEADYLLKLLPDGLAGRHLQLVDSEVEVGSGSLPGVLLPSLAMAVNHPRATASKLAALFRQTTPAVIGYIHRGHFTIDLKAVPESDVLTLARVMVEVLTSIK